LLDDWKTIKESGAMSLKNDNNQTVWRDPDETSELTDEWFEAAYQYQGDALVKRGRGRPPIPISER
jgi:hypothetical protein